MADTDYKFDEKDNLIFQPMLYQKSLPSYIAHRRYEMINIALYLLV